METIKQLSKRLLLKEYLQLREDYMTTEDKLKKKLQKERTKSELLQEELEKKKASNTDFQESESEVPAQQQQAAFLNPETDEKLKSLEDRVLNDQRVITNLTAERDTLTQEVADINTLKEEAIKKQEDLLEENEELKHELSLKKCLDQENEELKEKIKTSQEEFNTELQLAKQNNILLQQHYNALRVAYQKLGETYQTQVVTVRNQAVNVQNQLKKQVQSNANRKREDQWLIRKLKTDLKALRGKTTATIISQKKYFFKIEQSAQLSERNSRKIRRPERGTQYQTGGVQR
ncbi:rho-associated protein kinase 1-like [Notolabrus celidotus]|uniref:rho-associated protein kinase 1-like n=1 Tax=Notolabrus celidotus TaxID=1203425 RepID=UPI00148FCEF8|nr:rho-associated protein kinase 1-like [Notolabrus celidotus]